MKRGRLPWGLKSGHTAKGLLRAALGQQPKTGTNKFNARRTEAHGIWFDSAKEARRYDELLLLVVAGVISDLELQPTFVLQEAYTESNGTKHRKMEYQGDFQYDEKGVTVVEDVKGSKKTQTRDFRLKWKLFRNLYPKLDGRLITKDP